jgi:hypothetical protein
MPFDTTPTPPVDMIDRIKLDADRFDAIAVQTATVLDMVEFFFGDGSNWVQHRWRTRDGKRCLLDAVRFVRREIRSDVDLAEVYLGRVICDSSWERLGGLGYNDIVMFYNDAAGRTYPEIAALIREAKMRSSADRILVARDLDEQRRNMAVGDYLKKQCARDT